MNTNLIDTMIKFDTHTIGNLLQSYLLKYFLNNEISLVGYKVPHPLEVKCIVRVEPKQNQPNPEDNINFVKDLMINVSRRIINILTDCRKDWVKYTHIKPEIEELLAVVSEDKKD
jgi:DNA-directed RNA polymerase subunit L